MSFLIENKMIIDYVKQYMIENDLDNIAFDQVNYVWLYKKMIIPTELVRARERDRTDAYNELEDKSILK